MNPVPTASTWWQLALVLGTGTAAVVLAATLLGRLRPNAHWERSVWVLGTLSLAALLLAELTGLPSAVLAWCGVPGSLSRPAAPSEGQGLASPSTHSTGGGGGREAHTARSRAVSGSSTSVPLDSPGAGRSTVPPKDNSSRNPQGGPTGPLSPGTETGPERGAPRSEKSPSSIATVGAAGQPGETGRAVDEGGARQTGERLREPQDDARHSDGPPTRPSAPLAEEGALWWPGLVWLLGAVLVAGRALLGQVLALCWRGLPVRDEALCQRVRRLAERLGVRRVRLVVGRQLSGPIALGVLRPTIGLPEGFTAELDDAQQEAVLAHELGHLAAHDPAWHLLADLVTAALWWHPLAWWSRRRFQFASEAAADETCLLLANGPLVLAGCLVALAGRRVRSQAAGLAIDGQAFRSSLGRRVERLLRLPARPWEPSGRARSALLQTLGPAVLVAFVVLATSWFRPGLQEQGDSPMNVLHSSWKRSLVACVLMVGSGPDDRPAPAAGPPDKGRAVAPAETRTATAKAVADAEVEAAVRLANEQLRRDFPEAPLLAAGDLQSAEKHAEGRTEIVLERRRVAPDRNPFSFVYARIERPNLGEARVTVKAHLVAANAEPLSKAKAPKRLVNLVPPPIATDRSVKYDYDIVYVRVPRKGDETQTRFAEAGNPLSMEPGADLMVLHPDGSEEVLVKGGRGAVADPFVSFDGDWVYYSLFQDTQARGILVPSTADIYKIHVKTRKVVQLTHAWKEFTPNTGAAEWSPDYRTPAPGKTTMPYPVCNTGPCPLPGGKVIFTSNRNGFVSPRSTNTGYNVPLQLFVMDDDGSNVEMIGHLNVGCALHPVVLMDGRVMFSTLENQGQRDDLAWGLWSIHPDGSNWGPLVSAFRTNATHFQTQLSDGHIVVGHYYAGGGTQGFGTYFTLPAQPPPGSPGFGPAARNDPRNRAVGFPFSPAGMEYLTRFADHSDQTWVTVPGQKKPPGSPHYGIGKFTQPAGAPDNHLLTTWSPVAGLKQAVDSGIYLIKSGQPIDEPGQMLLIKNDPRYNEQWPRALVPYKRIYGVDEPRSLKPLANDGKLSPHLPEGTAFGLVGASSLYKRETVPEGQVARGSVTAGWAGDNPMHPHLWGESNWIMQGADAGLYANDDVHAVRILVMEPTTARRSGPKADRLFRSHAMERLRILGEIPVRKFSGDKQPMDPDGNPDSSFLAKIPANVAWTFQTLDKKGMVLNMAQTWHQLRPGEVRNDCGGCHAHSQQPTLFKDTAAARPDYVPFDLTRSTPLLTSRANDQSKKKWDAKDETGLRYEPGVKTIEFHRDVKPILDRSCVACHTRKWDKPAGNLVLDDDKLISWRHEPNGADLPGTYVHLAVDNQGRHGPKPLSQYGQQASRYVWKFQARRSLLIWRVFGQRLDGFRNDDFPAERVPGDPNTLQWKGQPVPNTPENRRRAALAYTGSVMPPLEAVAGSYVGPDGKKLKVAGLSDEDRRTLVRWIDLGCPIDLDYDPARPGERGYGWMLDDNRPTLTVTYPRAGANAPLTRLLVGMHDYYTGLDLESFSVVADFPLDGLAAGENLAKKFKPLPDSRWELKLARPITDLPRGKLTVAVKDRQGNTSRMERTFSVGKK